MLGSGGSEPNGGANPGPSVPPVPGEAQAPSQISGHWYLAEHHAVDEHRSGQDGSVVAQAQAVPVQAAPPVPAKGYPYQGAPASQSMGSVASAQAGQAPQGSQGFATPPVVAEAVIVQQYQQQGFDTSALGSIPVATAEAVPQAGSWFSPEEVALLHAQPVPPGEGHLPTGGVPGQVVLQPGNGGLPVMPNATSTAKVEKDSMKGGILSRDEVLSSKEEIFKFLNQHNSRPRMFVAVHGYHYERSTRYEDGRSNDETRTQTDFRYRIDITDFIFPFGKVTCESSSKSVDTMVENFIRDTNKLRSLQMKKTVVWNSKALVHLVKSYIRQSGWRDQLDVTIAYESTSIRIADDNELAQAYDNCCCRVMMFLTVVPAVLMCIYGNGHRERGLKSIFVIEATPLQVFESIRPQLYGPRRGTGGCMVQ